LVPQPLSFFTSTAAGTNVAAATAQLLNNKTNDDGGTVTEPVKQKTTGKPLNIQNLTIVQQIQLLALIQQYQTMQRPKSTSPPKMTPQPNTDKPAGPNHQQLASGLAQQKQSVVDSVAVKESPDLDEELYKLLHATPIRTPKRQNQPTVSALPADEISSDTVNNLLSSLMKSKQSDKQQQDLAQLASETADLLPTFTAGLLKPSAKDDDLEVTADNHPVPSDDLPADLLSSSSSALNRNITMETLPSFDSDSSSHFGLFNLDNLLEVIFSILAGNREL